MKSEIPDADDICGDYHIASTALTSNHKPINDFVSAA
jgi:hypothetical protein